MSSCCVLLDGNLIECLEILVESIDFRRVMSLPLGSYYIHLSSLAIIQSTAFSGSL